MCRVSIPTTTPATSAGIIDINITCGKRKESPEGITRLSCNRPVELPINYRIVLRMAATKPASGATHKIFRG
ncbi:hypothetical protein GCM10023187_45770 [Nibrella viscosa]|uniref:Uncharacterized protein n=1 Tax=Nibrella viscosa TaxID=1084524 RepID=A0ABP8KSH9_9BACT